MKKQILAGLKIIGAVAALLLVILGLYATYVFLSYHRIPDMQELAVVQPAESGLPVVREPVKVGQEYTAISYNIGFGAYTPDFSFFMDGGVSSWAKSKDSVLAAVSGASLLMQEQNPDFMCVQEVDIDGTRTYHVNENEIIRNFFSSYYETEAVNYDSPFLFYPLTQPHGKNKSELAFFSAYPITEGIRRSLPVSDSVNKIVDYDRCYSVSRVPVENGREICFYNVHLSAYGMDESVREGQVGMLREDMEKELEKGNYIICGGDFNHDLKATEGARITMEWAQPLPRTRLVEGVHFPIDDLDPEVLANMHDSGRNTDQPYQEGETMTVTLDGFIVSDNVKVTSYEVLNTGYRYSDHEPVVMKFVLSGLE